MFDGEQLTFRSHSIDNRDGLYKKSHKKLHLECEEFLGLEHLDLSATEKVTLVGVCSPIDLTLFLTAPLLKVLEIKNSPGLTPTEANFEILNQLRQRGVSSVIMGSGSEFVRAWGSGELDPELAAARASLRPPRRALLDMEMERRSRVVHACSEHLEGVNLPLRVITPPADIDQLCPQPPDLTKRGR